MPVAATVIGDRRVRTVLTAHDMPAESRRAAALDRRHHLQLAEAHMASIGLRQAARGRGRCPQPPELDGHQRRASSGRLVLLDLANEMIERAGDVADRSGGNLRVARRRVELGMSEQHLDHANIDSSAPRDGWRSCAAAYAETRASRSRPPAQPCGRRG
jgi:hypothetical protein